MDNPGSKLLICDGCDQHYKHKINLIIHITKICQKMPIFHTASFICDQCDRPHKHKGDLGVHIRTTQGKEHSSTRDTTFAWAQETKCDDCGRNFKSKGPLVVHMGDNHGNKDAIFTCDLCSKRFNWKWKLVYHIQTQHQHICVFECQLCAAEYRSQAGLQWHKKRIHQGVGLECDECGKLFGDKKDLFTHVSCVHQKLRQFECVVCGDKFSQPAALRLHTEVKHIGKRIQCDDCSAKFGQRTDLIRHVGSVHLKLNLFKCGQCPATFNRPHRLKQHKQRDHL